MLDLKVAQLYGVGEHCSVHGKKDNVILTFHSEDEDGGGEWVEGEATLASLIGVRAELGRGDLRALYLGWLLGAQSGDLDDDAIEPPVPPGLATLSPSLEGLIEFLRIDRDLVAAAAVMSEPASANKPQRAEIRAWVAKLSLSEKEDIIARMIETNDTSIVSELVQRQRREHRAGRGTATKEAKRRTVANLLYEAKHISAEQKRHAAEWAAKEKARRAIETKAARSKHLAQLAGKEALLWRKIENLVAAKQMKAYDEAVGVLVDLRDLATKTDAAGFRQGVAALRAAHARKPAFIDRLNKAGLVGGQPP